MVDTTKPNFINQLNKNTENSIVEAIYRLNVGVELGEQLCYDSLYKLLHTGPSATRDTQLGILLNGLLARKPTAEEIVGLTKAAFSLDNFDYTNKIKLNLPKNKKLVGAVGSGKKGFKTMNISTAAMLVAASVGIYTAKPGSSATSSVTGSADILRYLGVNIDISVEKMISVILKSGFGIFPIESTIPKFDNIYGGRFFAPHALSLVLPALLCPVKLDSTLYGLAHPYVETSIKAFKLLNIDNIMVVSTTGDGIHYLDELGVYGTTKIMGIRNKKIGECIYFQPTEILNLPPYTPKDIEQGHDINANIQYFLGVLNNTASQARIDVVCMNAGTLIYLAGEASDLKSGYLLAKQAINKKLPLEKLIQLIELSGGNKKLLLNKV